MRVLELFAGIGGCAAALDGRAEVVCAVEHNEYAKAVYTANFPSHRFERWNLQWPKAERLAALDADLWWMSPPCQPFTVRGKRLDIDDKRCRPLVALTQTLREVRPRHLALENVPGFADSRMRAQLVATLDDCGYHWRERSLCPTALGIPMRRDRYYLVASRDPLPDWKPDVVVDRPVTDFLMEPAQAELYLSDALLERFAGKLPVSDAVDCPWVGCFTSAYGKSPVYAGSYWRDAGGVRHFHPAEVLRFLGFPDRFRLPESIDLARGWKLVGNSLSVDAVRAILRPLGR